MSFTATADFGKQRAAGRQDVGETAEHHVAFFVAGRRLHGDDPGFTVVMTGA